MFFPIPLVGQKWQLGKSWRLWFRINFRLSTFDLFPLSLRYFVIP